MSVLKKDRTLSKLEFYNNARKLRLQLTLLMGRDFGIRPRIREPTFYTKKWNPEDTKVFLEILEKYRISKTVDDYPLWMVEDNRRNIQRLLSSMMRHITLAYTTWATTKAEADLRRTAQDKAIADCESLLQEMDFIVSLFPVKAEKLIRYVEIVQREIALLKGWRKSDNKRFKDLT